MEAGADSLLRRMEVAREIPHMVNREECIFLGLCFQNKRDNANPSCCYGLLQVHVEHITLPQETWTVYLVVMLLARKLKGM